jgi:hypothetical protein
MTLQQCENGSYWSNTISVKNVKEGLEQPYIVEKCNIMDGCTCTIEKIIPEKARGMLFDTVYVHDTYTLLELGHKEVV